MTSEAAPDRRVELIEALTPVVDDPERLIEVVAPRLQMPRTCPGVFVIAENLASMDQPLRAFADRASAFEEVLEFATAVCAVPIDHPLRGYPSLGARGEGRRGWGPFHAYLESHPVWCALWYRAHGPMADDESAYRHLQSILLAAYNRLEETQRHDTRNRLYPVGLLVRELRLVSTRPRLRRLGAAAIDAACLREALLEQRDEEDAQRPEALRKRLRDAAALLEDAFGLERETHRRSPGAGRRRTGPARPHWAEEDGEPDYTHYWYAIRHTEYAWGNSDYTVYGELPGGEDGEAIRAAGGDPCEYGHSAEIGIDWRELEDPVEEPEQTSSKRRRAEEFPDDLPPLQTLYVRARRRERSQTMDVQRFPLDIRRIRRRHIAAIVQVLLDVFAESSVAGERASDTAAARRRRMAAQRAATALVTATPYAETRACVLVDSPAELGDNYRLAYSARHGVWIKPAVGIERSSSPPAAPSSAHRMRCRIVLPDIWGVGRVVNIQNLRHGNQEEELEVWRREIRPRLLDAGVPSKWTTLAAMSSVLPSHCRGLEEGDGLTVALLFGQVDALASTHQFYTAYGRRNLTAYYLSVMKALWRAIRPRAPAAARHRLFEWTERRSLRIDGFTGDDWAPTSEQVRPLIEAAGQWLRTAPDEASPYDRHNRLVLYTALGLAIATGFRAVRTPIPDLGAIHWPTATMCLQEKDRGDASHARLVVLPSVVVDQVRIYLRHAQAVYGEMAPSDPMHLELRASKHRDVRRADAETGSYRIDLRRTLYFWKWKDGEGFHPVELTGQRLLEYCRELAEPACWPVANAGRHLLRSDLTEQGCPATVINAALGHWSQGEEPWVAASGMDPLRYRETIRPYLVRLLSRVGYQALEPRWL